MGDQDVKCIENIHRWIIESKTSIIRGMFGATLTLIVSLIGILYTDHNLISAHDNMINKSFPKLNSKVDSLVLIPYTQNTKINNMEKDIQHLLEEQKNEKEERKAMRERQNDIYDVVLKIARKND